MAHVPEKLANAETSLQSAQGDLETIKWEQENSDNPHSYQEKIDAQVEVVEDKQRIVNKWTHEYDVAVTTSYAASKAHLKSHADNLEQRSRAEEGLRKLAQKQEAHDAKIAGLKAKVAQLKAKGPGTADARRKLETKIEALRTAGAFSRSDQQLAADLERQVKSATPLPLSERLKHESIVARGDAMKADGSWDTHRRERHVRFALVKYEKVSRSRPAQLVSDVKAFFANPRLLVDALSALPLFPRGKTGGGRDLTPVEQEALDEARREVLSRPVEDYLSAEGSADSTKRTAPPTPTLGKPKSSPTRSGSSSANRAATKPELFTGAGLARGAAAPIPPVSKRATKQPTVAPSVITGVEGVRPAATASPEPFTTREAPAPVEPKQKYAFQPRPEPTSTPTPATEQSKRRGISAINRILGRK